MPKALFFNVPAHGHVNPSLPLVTELVRRGHHITYFATEHFRARVEATGAHFQPYAAIHDDYFPSRRLHGGVLQRVAYELMRTTADILPDLLEQARAAQPDYILYDGMCPWGYAVAQALRLPAVVSLSLMPLNSPPLRNMMTMLPILLPAVLRDFSKGLQANKHSQALGKQYNFPPLSPTVMLSAPGDLAISYTSYYFQPFADTVSKTVRFVGRTVHDVQAPADFSLDAARGRPVIYVSLGTMNNVDTEFFETCIRAFKGSDAYVVISTGNGVRPDSFGALPENVAVHAWVPQAYLLERAALFITHAGLNSVHDGLYFGVPLLLIPQQAEQTINARRVVELGAGLMLKKDQVRVETIRTSVAQLLHDRRFRQEAHRIGESFRNAGGMQRAVDEIENLLRQRGFTAV